MYAFLKAMSIKWPRYSIAAHVLCCVWVNDIWNMFRCTNKNRSTFFVVDEFTGCRARARARGCECVCACVRACVCACVRARARLCMCVCARVCLCVCVRVLDGEGSRVFFTDGRICDWLQWLSDWFQWTTFLTSSNLVYKCLARSLTT